MSSETVLENSTLCSVGQCSTPFDVHCFHCDSKICSQHYFEHKQQELVVEHDDAMDELLQLTSSKWFSITKGRSSVSKQYRRSFSNPFVSSSYLLKKMKQRAARRRNSIKPSVTTKTIAVTSYNLRKRRRKLITTTTITTTTSIDCCETIVKTKPQNNQFCNRKLPCPYHTVE